MGCDEIQGYLFGEPGSAEEATQRLEARQPVRRKRRARRKGGAA